MADGRPGAPADPPESEASQESEAPPVPRAALEAAGEAVRDRMAATYSSRETTLDASRRVIRFAANAIRAAHRGDRQRADELVQRSRQALDEARAASAEHPAVANAGFLTDAEKEYAEARCTIAVIAGEPFPGPEQLGITDSAWLNGLAETVGELRRHLLDVLRADDLERCEDLLATMDEIYALLVTIDFPDGVTGGLRRSTDVARSIIERTRGDLTTALVQARLRRALRVHAEDVLGT